MAKDGPQRQAVSVVNLKTEYLDCPMGLDVAAPRFSWQLLSAHRNVCQSAYRIEAASSEHRLNLGHADVWDSGRVPSDSCFEILYEGRPLRSGERVFWRVRVWDEAGRVSEPSDASWFEMGLLSSHDWSAHWLVAQTEDEAEDRAAGMQWIWGSNGIDDKPVKFRFHFSLSQTPDNALLMLSAKDNLLGAWVNGRELDAPSSISWGTMVQIPIALKAGENIVCIEARAETEGFLTPDGGALAAMLRVAGGAGTVERFVTGPHWRASDCAKGDWISPSFDDRDWPNAVPSIARIKCEPWPAGPAMLLRRQFEIAKPVARARLYATALGVYEGFLNGIRIGAAHLSPEIGTAEDYVQYQCFDITELLRSGRNALGVMIGDGWYAGAFGWRSERFSLGDGPKRFLGQLVVEYEDGCREIIASDKLWRIAPSAVVFSEIYNGEKYDARLEQQDWALPDFVDSHWSAVAIGETPDVALVSQLSPPIREIEVLKPVGIRESFPGIFVVDFGQNFSGWCRLRAKGPAGTDVTLRYAEILLPDGQVDQSNLRAAAATDVYTLRGDPAGESYEPHFTYHGFRYIQIGGYPGPLDADAIEGIVVHSAAPSTGVMTVTNGLVQHIYLNGLWSQRSNFFGVPTDCPQRDERMGWLGDIQVFLEAAAFNMDVDAFIRRYLRDVRTGQTSDGAYPVVAPQPRSFPSMLTAGWSEAGIILPWTLYRYYGDTRVIDENWPAMSRWMQFLQEANPDFVWRNRRGLDLGDWLSVDAVEPADETTPRILVATAYWAHAAQLMSEMARATQRDEEASRYAQTKYRINRAFCKAFLHADGVVGNGSQTSYVLALKFDLLPESVRNLACEHLAADIRKRGMKLSTGFLGTPYLLDVLSDWGQTDIAISLLLQTDYPSWGYMVRKGATTMWERWNSDVGDVAMNSFNHYAYGAVISFLYRRLAGISPMAPGFKRIKIRPLFDARIGRVSAAYQSCLGEISTDVRGDANGLSRLALNVPANAAAQIVLPVRKQVWLESGEPLQNRNDLMTIANGPNQIVLEVGSGGYLFHI